MGKKPKCTVEEKISAVEDYLNEKSNPPAMLGRIE